jgi:hypothetical protein
MNTLLRFPLALVTAALLMAGVWPAPLHAQAAVEAIHGADGVFVSPDIAIVWAVLKEPAVVKEPAQTTGDRAAVWLRIVNRSRAFSRLSIDGVDPFTSTRERLESGVALAQEARIGADRGRFSDLPSRELHFYRSDDDWRAERPALNVYYLGVPDTTPEFSTRAAMDAYLDGARLVAHPVVKK